ncbi:hypothetical protein [Agrobacterium arsenijevicii]|uniref:hypothetical protein n=2 Tax=Agrobacterium arsenijevicii TaxID=1585697 RepID=UPI00330635A6
MSAASVAVMYSDRKKTARAFVKFFVFFSGRLCLLLDVTGKKPGTAGFSVKTTPAVTFGGMRKLSFGSRGCGQVFCFCWEKPGKPGIYRGAGKRAFGFSRSK